MLTRREILSVLMEIGIKRLSELKRVCRVYENYFSKLRPVRSTNRRRLAAV